MKELLRVEFVLIKASLHMVVFDLPNHLKGAGVIYTNPETDFEIGFQAPAALTLKYMHLCNCMYVQPLHFLIDDEARAFATIAIRSFVNLADENTNVVTKLTEVV